MAFQDYLENTQKIKRKIASCNNDWYEVHFQQVESLKLLKDALRTGGLTHGEIHYIADVVEEISQIANVRQPKQDSYLGEAYAR